MAQVANFASRIASTARFQNFRFNRPTTHNSVVKDVQSRSFFGTPFSKSLNARTRSGFRFVASTPVLAMAKKSVGDLATTDLKGKHVFVRADLNVPLDAELNITDDTRVRAAVPTLKYLVENGAKVLLSSHLVSTCFARGG